MACTTGDATLMVVPGAPITGPVADVPVLISVSPVDGDQRTPSDIVCVIDISWSMSMEVKVQSSTGAVESNGLSMLDIAKHAVRTIIRTLGPKDRIGLVQFCREAEIKLPLTEMTEAGRELAEKKLDEMGYGNGTSLWNGMERGLQCLANGSSSVGRLGHIMVLTDGETEDKGGVVTNVKDYKMRHERLPGTMNFFGFGYEIDSPLLVELALFCDGSYAFIPDGGFVGTCFVNAVSNLQATMARDSVLTLEADSGAEVIEVLGGWEYKKDSDGIMSINLGTLQYGQTKDIVLRMSIKSVDEAYLFACLEYSTVGGRGRAEANAKPPGDPKGAEFTEPQRCRSLVVDALNNAVKASMTNAGGRPEALPEAQRVVKEVAAIVQASPAAGQQEVAGLLEDLLGQSTEAMSSEEYWRKWGRHYIPSVASAHKLQQCNNFKDPGVQFYGSKLFGELRDAADAAFDTLPAPVITPAMYRYLGGGRVIHNPLFQRPGGAVAPPPQPQVSMAAYNDRYAGCVDGACFASLASGECRRLAELVKGDVVLAAGPDGASVSAEVLCMVRSRCHGGFAALSELPGKTGSDGMLRLTPYHPVRSDSGEWRFPVELGRTAERECEAVYSFILRGAPSLLVEGAPCVAWGHGLAEGAAAHPYFASQDVLEDLKILPGYSSGLVDLLPEHVLRDPETGLVCGLREPAEA